jgi:H+-translocating NAD(P) transhydrogenase subunit beta
MEYGFTTAAYVVAAVLIIQSLGGLSGAGKRQARGLVWHRRHGAGGCATLIGPGAGNWLIVAVMIAVGGAIGWVVAQRVQMTEMPQLVAAMHSLVGLAAVFIGFNAHIEMVRIAGPHGRRPGRWPERASPALKVAKKDGVEINILRVEVFLGVFIGAVTFTGSVIAYGKLAGKVDGKAKKLPGGHVLNAGAAILRWCCW